jgi:hypothetical protein
MREVSFALNSAFMVTEQNPRAAEELPLTWRAGMRDRVILVSIVASSRF